ncbi:MAG: hypothetical protein M1828_007643, partial [Chrysothrix sp. TS-e1954]
TDPLEPSHNLLSRDFFSIRTSLAPSEPDRETDRHLQVVARFRPPNKIEQANNGESIVAFDTEDTCNINSRETPGAFTFDRVFDTQSRQTDVFDFSIRPTVDDILNGYNGTVFAYGQTGAGKSYTMMGADIDDEDLKGLIPRIVEQIFASIMTSPANIEYTVRVSYMEIYMERIRDLLQPANDNLPIHEEKNRGVYVKGLLEVYVGSVAEVLEVMRRGGLARATAATNMNQESSRSHSIFVITVGQKNIETGSAKSGQLFLVDLAGSEKVGKTGASGQTLEEAKKINKSLSALGMVINSLTDNKSTHVPYRDSKLTRILQESLGGNSRTSLIINCSPSSYNVDETISTLRFGSRAKKIQNKAKINAELSPTELKALLKKSQGQVASFEDYIATLESEVGSWRKGESVPQERWTPARGQAQQPAKRPESRQPLPSTPSRMTSSDGRRMESPSRPESRLELDRASTPSVILEKDEREDFLKRENELQDLLSERESAVARAEEELMQAREELSTLKSQQKQASGDNERLTREANEFKTQFERLKFENNETLITMESIKEANAELTSELDEVKQHLIDAKISVSETTAVLDEREKKKAERMAQMMAGFEQDGETAPSENELTIMQIIKQVDQLYDSSVEGKVVTPDELENLRKKLLEVQGVLRQAELSMSQRDEHAEVLLKRREALEERLTQVKKEKQELLEKGLSEADIEDVKRQLGDGYTNKQSLQDSQVEDLKAELARSTEEKETIRKDLDSLQQRVSSGAFANSKLTNGAATNGGKTIQQQIADFDVMKRSLMRDLQNRCERVVELEMSLDETRDQYNNVLKTSNNRQQMRKISVLERNLQQLMEIHKNLQEQNANLKKESSMAERRLAVRTERIDALEGDLKLAIEMKSAEKQKYVYSPSRSRERDTKPDARRFEVQLAAVKEKLENAKAGSTKGLPTLNSPITNGAFNFGGTRIAKPIRGGGTPEGNLQAPETSNRANRMSGWFSNVQQRFS